MFTEALHSIVDLLQKKDRPVTTTVNGKEYAVREDGTLGGYVEPVKTPQAPAPVVATLSGFVEAYKANIDSFPKEVAVRVTSFGRVELMALREDEFGRRRVFAVAEAPAENPFKFGAEYEPEDFLIALQMCFFPTQNVSALSKLCSSLKAGNSIATSDDGFSQKVTVEEGSVSSGAVEIPNRLALSPYRTFREIDAVAGDFLIRLKGRKDALPTIKLIDVDGGKWKLDTALAVAGWLRVQLPEATIIA